MPKNKIIVALDVPHVILAQGLVDKLFGEVGGFKIGLEFSNAMKAELLACPKIEASQTLNDYRELFTSLRGNCFFDEKFMDIPNVVADASRAVARLGVKMFDVHCLGGLKMMEAARQASEDEASKLSMPRPLVLGVTILTSLDGKDLLEMGFLHENMLGNLPNFTLEQAPKTIAIQLAELAQKAGLDGVVASPLEIKAIREACGPDFLIVTPGIRASDAPADDQKRTLTAGEAIDAGADFLVIGRPITKAVDPIAASKAFNTEITQALEAKWASENTCSNCHQLLTAGGECPLCDLANAGGTLRI